MSDLRDWGNEPFESLEALNEKGEQVAEEEDGNSLRIFLIDPIIEIDNVKGLIESAHTVEVKLAQIQANESSPLFSVQRFEDLGLSEELLKGIYSMKFVKPSKVQEKAPQNMVAQSQSGTGKTAAFTLTMLSRVDPSLPQTQAICLAPARELALQIMDVVKQMGQFTQCTYAFAVKEDTGVNREAVNAHIVIGTPGTIIDMVRKRLLDVSNVKIFVLDEADVMLDKQGMGDQSIRVRKDDVREFAKRIAQDANEITLKREELSVDAIKQLYMDCKNFRHKFEVLSALYGLLTIGQSIIFVHTKKTADELQDYMRNQGHSTCLLHGGMEPSERDKIINDFRKGVTKVLITTNVLARGIDIQQVSLVINFDIPLDANFQPDPETYLHRIGRTGRFGRSGVAINFVHDHKSLENLLEIQKFFGKEIIRVDTHSIAAIEEKLKDI
ncbi:ATP-dependent RNA helicase-like protein dbp5 [Rozella allomycis CSF55]|uniref:RNA helicase n=1 Tax=Rozella allomycis (strain CSF55) TaxID=988480 RepID=A0A075ARV7_ROZAC|nr:Helicase domain-containing protein [Rozella allomycis CSF55]RKP19645.1 ATP-dependent RNA helicase-like protein dbp5 [Rozella allomycis CSF55]|eukprot:EPZ32910.1 Helicase domain-containing protein [Rozella allomycis CSF55]